MSLPICGAASLRSARTDDTSSIDAHCRSDRRAIRTYETLVHSARVGGGVEFLMLYLDIRLDLVPQQEVSAWIATLSRDGDRSSQSQDGLCSPAMITSVASWT
jgi:hypothetical protein